MTKIDAVNKLIAGECDYIKYGVSIFVLHNDDVVNKRSKKPIDMKHMMQGEWEAIVEPKWYDNVAEKPVLCWVDNSSISLISAQRENGDFEDSIGNVYASAEPITMSDVKKYIYDEKDSFTIDVEPELETPLAKGEEPPFTGGFVGVMDPKIDTQVFKNNEPATIEGETNISNTGEDFSSGDAESGNEECQNEKSETTATQKVVSFSGTPALVAANKNYFIDLGLDPGYWTDFWQANNFDSISITEAMEKGDEYCAKLITDFTIERELSDKDEIPF